MTRLPEFRLETHMAAWEFRARHHLTASDCQTVSVAGLLELAEGADRRAWEELELGYTETRGDPGLREAVAAEFEHAEPRDVICFAGAEEGIYLALQVLLASGGHAVVVTPCYQSAETVALSLGEVTGVPLEQDGGRWRLDAERVVAALRPDTRVVYVNFPHNPTGALIAEGELRRVAEECRRRGAVLLSDEVYRGLEPDPRVRLPQAADLCPTAMSLNVTSKSLGLPGLRVGWIVCRDPGLVDALERAKHYTTICNAAPSEVLARIAVKARGVLLERNRAIIAENLEEFDRFFAEFAGLFDWRRPEAGPVAYPRYLGPEGVEEFCARLAAEAGVLLLPASVYASELTAAPADRFRVGLGRRSPGAGLAAWASWLRRGAGR